MSKRVQYSNGSIGAASDKVAAILEKKGAAKIIPDKPEAPKVPKSARELAEEKAVKLGIGKAEDVAKLSDADLSAAIEKAEKK